MDRLASMAENIETDETGRQFVFSDTGVKVFVDFKDNLIVDPHDPVITGQARNWRFSKGHVKGLSRLGSENSEDALTWNVFKTLAKSDPASWLPEILPPITLDEDERFTDAGLRFWDKYFPPMTRPFPEGETVVDLTIETSKKLIFVAAKYQADISSSTKHDPDRDQIIRNIDVGTWAAKKIAKEFYFVLLTLQANTYSIEKLLDYKSNPSRISEAIGSYRKDITDYAALCANLHVVYWDQILAALQTIRSADQTGFNTTNVIDYLSAKLA